MCVFFGLILLSNVVVDSYARRTTVVETVDFFICVFVLPATLSTGKLAVNVALIFVDNAPLLIPCGNCCYVLRVTIWRYDGETTPFFRAIIGDALAVLQHT